MVKTKKHRRQGRCWSNTLKNTQLNYRTELPVNSRGGSTS